MGSSYRSSKRLASMASITAACCRLPRQPYLAAPRNWTEISDTGFSFGRPGCMSPVHLEEHPPGLVDRCCFWCLDYLARVACTRHSTHNEQIAHAAEASSAADSWRYQTDSTTLPQVAWPTSPQDSCSAAEFLCQSRSPADFASGCCRRSSRQCPCCRDCAWLTFGQRRSSTSLGSSSTAGILSPLSGGFIAFRASLFCH